MGAVCPNPVTYFPEELPSGHCALMPAKPDLIVCESAGEYVPRNPEKTVLYNVVVRYLETFLARQRERDKVVPHFVEQELRAFLDCGVLARGFLRVHCDACGLDRLVPYSCKKRGFCPSCGGRRMADTAAHLVDRVFPEVPVRQWVLSVPYALRCRLAYDSSLVRDVLQIFVRTIFASIRRRAGIPASNRQARCGAVAFIQRFSDALNLDPHFHLLVLDGLYVMNGQDEPAFRRVSPPTDKEVAQVAERVHRRVARLMEIRDLGPQADPDEADGLRRDQPLLAELYSASVAGRVAMGRRAGMRIARVGDEVDPEDGALPSGACCAAVAGFSVHAGVRVPARDRLRLERLARYAGRPPLATERLSLLPDGRLLYRLKRCWRDGTTRVIYEPLELMERLAALVHPPRFNITRFYGIFAPAASLRPRVTPETEVSSPPRHPGCQSAVEAEVTNPGKLAGFGVADTHQGDKVKVTYMGRDGTREKFEAPATDPGKNKKKRGCQPRNYQWATLMERVFDQSTNCMSRRRDDFAYPDYAPLSPPIRTRDRLRRAADRMGR
ncbi:MAG: transposase [Acidobacteriia bacterium]|nr:transposase [Terriglobia bacterium]